MRPHIICYFSQCINCISSSIDHLWWLPHLATGTNIPFWPTKCAKCKFTSPNSQSFPLINQSINQIRTAPAAANVLINRSWLQAL